MMARREAGHQPSAEPAPSAIEEVPALPPLPQFVRMLPNGGHDLTTALIDQLGLRADRADDVKRRYGIRAESSDPQSEFVARVNAEGARDIGHRGP